jgi:hypothetical protein
VLCADRCGWRIRAYPAFRQRKKRRQGVVASGVTAASRCAAAQIDNQGIGRCIEYCAVWRRLGGCGGRSRLKNPVQLGRIDMPRPDLITWSR